MKQSFQLEQLPDTRPGLTIELGPQNLGVGRWVPEQKHALLGLYLEGTREAWKKWPERVFIDPFCGPGRIQVRGELFDREGGAIAAWRKSQICGMPFSKMLVGDINPERAHACAARLTDLGAPVEVFVGPAVDTIEQMVKSVPDKALCLAYIDPYNLEHLSFSIQQKLADLRVDLVIHFSTMDLVRNVETEFHPSRTRFDEVSPGWRDRVDATRMSKSALPNAFFQDWCKLIASLGFIASKEMPLVYNDSGHPIYRLVLFSRHALPNRIWADVAHGPNRSFNFDVE